jgi:hypothetical protein
VAEYAADIYAHFKSEELTKSAKHGYMASQSDINEKVRTGARRARARGNGLRGDGARCSTGAEWGTLQRPGAPAAGRRRRTRAHAPTLTAATASPSRLLPPPQMRAILIVSPPRGASCPLPRARPPSPRILTYSSSHSSHPPLACRTGLSRCT